ncbi:MAG TPA: cyclic pyranopterin monophosphate synthase MoaC [Candidatus Azoamicus sp.]
MSYYKIIDISSKKISYRRACVFGAIYVGKDVCTYIKNGLIEKGDPLVLAEVAGINAIKNTSQLIMLCHPINIENAFLNVFIDNCTYNVLVYSFVFAHAKTGVEMEAMVGAVTALLTVYDLTKKFNPLSYISDVKLLFKDGGENPIGSLENLPDNFKKYFIKKSFSFLNINIFLVTISDRASFGRYEDVSGKVLVDFFISNSCFNLNSVILPDDKIILQNVLKNYIDFYLPDIVITSGGTGISSRDITFDVISNFCQKIIPGIGEFLRVTGSFYSSNSWLSRSVGGIYNKTLIVSLPGKPSAVLESLHSLGDLLLHAVSTIKEL